MYAFLVVEIFWIQLKQLQLKKKLQNIDSALSVHLNYYRIGPWDWRTTTTNVKCMSQVELCDILS